MQVLHAMWRLRAATVEQVRDDLPPRHKSSYNTIQTVLTRLAERGLLQRELRGRRYVYRAAITEAEYVSRSIREALAGASADARRAALASLIGGLEPSELSDLRRRARSIEGRRRRG